MNFACRAQVRDSEETPREEAHMRDDRGRRERRPGAEEGGHRDRGGGRDGRGARRVGHSADGAGAERDHQRGAHQPRHLPADEELHDLRGLDHDKDRARVHAPRAYLEVRLLAFHGSDHRRPQRRHDHDHLQGQGQALPLAGLMEAPRDLRHRHRPRHLPRRHHCHLLLARPELRLLHGK